MKEHFLKLSFCIFQRQECQVALPIRSAEKTSEHFLSFSNLYLIWCHRLLTEQFLKYSNKYLLIAPDLDEKSVRRLRVLNKELLIIGLRFIYICVCVRETILSHHSSFLLLDLQLLCDVILNFRHPPISESGTWDLGNKTPNKKEPHNLVWLCSFL